MRTLTTDYRYQDRIDAVADVYVMKPPRARGASSNRSRKPGSQPATIGEAGRLYGASLTFRKGVYFVRLVAYQDPGGGADLAGRGIDAEWRGFGGYARRTMTLAMEIGGRSI